MTKRPTATARAPSGPVVAWILALGALLVLAGVAVAAEESAGRSASAAVQRALEGLVSGKTLTWHDPPTGAAGKVTVVRTWKTQGGTFCRSYVSQWTAPAGPPLRGAACRTADALWLPLGG
ncbi:RT0821/Lpp0805 family surface protein [Zavarzinia sp. CC-PAN008]|uniref:RT0821/Lpp0805 family surface protein n=1 Tax=Zavarzinia sp. CC-PAN008 TaxID=3243332 RepID=UPI003F743471